MQNMTEPTEQLMDEDVQKKGMSTGAKWAVGCGIGCLTLIIIIAVGAFFGIRYLKGFLEEMTREFEELGFEKKVTQQTIEITESLR